MPSIHAIRPSTANTLLPVPVRMATDPARPRPDSATFRRFGVDTRTNAERLYPSGGGHGNDALHVRSRATAARQADALLPRLRPRNQRGWVIHVLAESLVYECPNCGAVIDPRRDQEVLTERSGGSLQFAAKN